MAYCYLVSSYQLKDALTVNAGRSAPGTPGWSHKVNKPSAEPGNVLGRCHTRQNEECLAPTCALGPEETYRQPMSRGEIGDDKINAEESTDIAVYHRHVALPLADVFDFRELGEEPLLILSSETLCQLLGQHEVVHYDR